MSNVMVWAHRGASGDAPENTLAAFRLAAEVGADGIELDVHFTKDRQIVVTHDDNVIRVTGHDGWVRQMTLSELKALDFSNHMEAYAGEKIPTLEEVLQLVKPTGMLINIELKTNFQTPEGLEEAVQMLVEKYGMEDRIIYSSFNHYSLKQMREVAPEMPQGILYEEKLLDACRYGKEIVGVQAIHPCYEAMNVPGEVERCHEAGLRVHPWTVNTEEDMKWMLDIGVDAIITNYPAKCIELRNKHR